MGAAVVGWVKAAGDAQLVGVQTDTVLKSTAGAAGMTKDAIEALAGAFMNETTFEDDAIQSAENVLLRYTSIGKDVFPAATQAVLDMATAMANGAIPTGESLTSTAVLIGKALDGDTAILTGLQRAGVVFNDTEKEMLTSLFGANAALVDQQKAASAATAALPDLHTQLNIAKMRLDEMEKSGSASNASLTSQNFTIKKLVEEIGGAEGAIKTYNDAQLAAGSETDRAAKVMQGQEIILDKLDQKFGGSAVAVGTTMLGAVERLRVGWGELGEDAGKVLLPAINNFLTTTINAFTSPVLQNAWLGFVNGIKAIIDPIFGRLATQFQTTAGVIRDAIAGGNWGAAISAMLNFLVGPGGAIPSVTGLIGTFISRITSALSAQWPNIERTLAPWATKFWAWIDQAKIDAGRYITDLVNWIGQKISEAVASPSFQATLSNIGRNIMTGIMASLGGTGIFGLGGQVYSMASNAGVLSTPTSTPTPSSSAQPSANMDTSDMIGQYNSWYDRAYGGGLTGNAQSSAISNLNFWRQQLHNAGVSGYQYGGIVPGPIGMPQQATVHGGERISNVTNNWNVTANYRNYQSEASLRDDIRLFQRLGATV
jgi:hypothetical protein